MIFRTYTISPIASKPLVEGISVEDMLRLEREEAIRFEQNETKEITAEEFISMVHEEFLLGVPLGDSVDDWLRRHLFTMKGRLK